MKIKVTIEEVISQEFEVEVSSLDNAYNEVRQMYRDGKIVVEDPNLVEASVMIPDENGNETNFVDMHVS